MNLHRAVVETLLILNASIFASVPAYACLDDQNEQCVLGACVCLPKVEDTGSPPLPQSGAFCYTPLGDDVKELRAHSKAKTSVAKLVKITKRTSA